MAEPIKIYYARSNEVNDRQYLDLLLKRMVKEMPFKMELKYHARGANYHAADLHDSDLVVVAFNDVEERLIGKGVYSQLDDAFANGIPVAGIMNDTSLEDGWFLYQLEDADVVIHDAKTWKEGYAKAWGPSDFEDCEDEYEISSAPIFTDHAIKDFLHDVCDIDEFPEKKGEVIYGLSNRTLLLRRSQG